MTAGGQLVGIRKFEIVTADGTSVDDAPPAAPGDAGVDASAPGDAAGRAASRRDPAP
jgi:hypothetical protein